MRKDLCSSEALSVPSHGKLDSIQVLRGIAALGVVTYHVFLATTIDVHAPADSVLIPEAALVHLCAAGVDIFFVISGFLMTYISEPYFSRRRPPLDFFAHRLIRIWPAYAVVTAFQCLVLARHLSYEIPFDLQPYRLLSFLFIPTFSDRGLLHPIVGPGWTLNYEMLFYFCFMVVLYSGRRWALLKLGAILGLLFAAGRWASLPAVNEFLGSPLLFEFLVGAAIGFAKQSGLLHLNRFWKWSCILATPILLKLLYDRWPDPDQRLMTFGVPATTLFLGFSSIDPNTKWPRWATLLGDASYSIYLVHALIINHFTTRSLALCREVSLCPVSTVSMSALAILAATLGGLLFYETVERPLLRVGKALYQRHRGAPARLASAAAQTSQR